jgi:hypothetical protein
MTTISATDTSTNGTIHRFGVRNRADSAAVVPRSVTKVAAMIVLPISVWLRPVSTSSA